MTISPRLDDGHPQAHDVLFDAAPTLTAPTERHWFVADESGHYCAACNLPRANRRHANKVGAA